MKPIDQLTPDERRGLIWPMTDTLRMEAAMCLWEAAMELRSDIQQLDDYWNDVGTVEMRHLIMTFSDPLHLAWHIHQRSADDDVLVPFDWEFSPWFLDYCIDWDRFGPSLKPNWADLARNLRARS